MMANEPTTEQMNEAIALFDGWKIIKGDPNLVCPSCDEGKVPSMYCICDQKPDRFEKDGKKVSASYFQYHTSWSWLMPVWGKLRGELFACMPASGINDGFDKYGDAWKRACFNAEIATAHKVVYSAIQWLNQQKQKDEST